MSDEIISNRHVTAVHHTGNSRKAVFRRRGMAPNPLLASTTSNGCKLVIAIAYHSFTAGEMMAHAHRAVTIPPGWEGGSKLS